MTTKRLVEDNHHYEPGTLDIIGEYFVDFKHWFHDNIGFHSWFQLPGIPEPIGLEGKQTAIISRRFVCNFCGARKSISLKKPIYYSSHNEGCTYIKIDYDTAERTWPHDL